MENLTRSVSPQTNILMLIYILNAFCHPWPFTCHFPSYSTFFHATVSYSEGFYELMCLCYHISQELTWNSEPNTHSKLYRKIKNKVMTTFKSTVFSKPGTSELIKDCYTLLNLKMFLNYLHLVRVRENLWKLLSCLWTSGVWQYTVQILEKPQFLSLL